MGHLRTQPLESGSQSSSVGQPSSQMGQLRPKMPQALPEAKQLIFLAFFHPEGGHPSSWCWVKLW